MWRCVFPISYDDEEELINTDGNGVASVVNREQPAGVGFSSGRLHLRNGVASVVNRLEFLIIKPLG